MERVVIINLKLQPFIVPESVSILDNMWLSQWLSRKNNFYVFDKVLIKNQQLNTQCSNDEAVANKRL